MANIYDIAKEANVSRSTVSRVINNQPSVSTDKRLRVLEAVEKLSYTPSATARALATNKTNTIGVISRELAHSFYDEFINSIHYGADYKNYGVLYTMRNAAMHTNINLSTVLHKKVDGYMLVGEGTASKAEIEALGHNDIPVVGYEFYYKLDKGLFININNKKSAYDAMTYLYSLKHERIIHVTYKSRLQEMRLREEGYNEAAERLGIQSAKVFDVAFEAIHIHQQCQEVMTYIKEHKVTAAFCANNIIASVLIEVLIEHGYDVPQDFSVIGFDDTPAERPLHISRQKIPEITSIKQPQKEMADYGLNALISAIEKDQPLESGNVMFDCEMVIRNTTSIKK